MAKTSRSKKSKQDQISEDLKVRIIATVGLFLIVVGAMKLGPIGEIGRASCRERVCLYV